jgi:3-deoxy-7-phosphoheptulonate synthase
MKPTDDLRITDARPMLPPAILHEEYPLSDQASEVIAEARRQIADVIHGRDRRLLVVVGPCSVHDPKATLEYAEKLCGLNAKVQDKLLIIMRAYFEKPRTSVGWKGLINDPDLDESFHINKGLRLARKLLLDLNEMGLPTASEFLDLQLPQHIADLTSWVAIGARTTESQVHRELASGLSMPVGFKNTTEGNVQRAVEAVIAAANSHWFPSITKQGVSSLFKTSGNQDCHIILRGGTQTGPNYESEHVREAVGMLQKNNLPTRVMIDASHGNSNKNHKNQAKVLESVGKQLKAPDHGVLGVMIESFLVEGRQDISDQLVYGQSVTDACINFDQTAECLLRLGDCVA